MIDCTEYIHGEFRKRNPNERAKLDPRGSGSQAHPNLNVTDDLELSRPSLPEHGHAAKPLRSPRSSPPSRREHGRRTLYHRTLTCNRKWRGRRVHRGAALARQSMLMCRYERPNAATLSTATRADLLDHGRAYTLKCREDTGPPLSLSFSSLFLLRK